MHRERFAPSPTGALHLGTAYSALKVEARTRAAGGAFLIRIEDIDRQRCRPEHATAMLDDLAWLGLVSDEPVLFQSTRTAAYSAALDALSARGLTYACICTRRDIAEASSAPQEGAAVGPDGPVYAGTCRGRSAPPEEPHAIRLNMARAAKLIDWPVVFHESGAGPAGETGRIAIAAEGLISRTGDIVLWRKDGAPAYHLAVAVDDAHQRISHVTRGRDLFSSTATHRVLQTLLGLPVPAYHHHALIRDGSGRRLAKRDADTSVRAMRDGGATAKEVRRLVGF